MGGRDVVRIIIPWLDTPRISSPCRPLSPSLALAPHLCRC